jgi:phage shock protein A
MLSQLSRVVPAFVLLASTEVASFTVGSCAATGPLCQSCCPQPPVRAAVQMNLADRFARLVKSNVNELLSSMEDPEKVLEQAVQDMQKDLVKVRQAYAEVSASSKRMQEQGKLAESEAAKWYSRAQLAIEKGEDELAREALTRRQQQLEMADSLKEQCEAQQGSITSLYESMKELEAKMAEAKAKKDQIIARARTAKAATKVNDMLAGVGTGSSMAAFDKMSEKVNQLESEAEVSKQLAASQGGSGRGTTIDQQFAALESGTSVEDELSAMKAALPPSAVDDELEAMKKMLEDEKGGKPPPA